MEYDPVASFIEHRLKFRGNIGTRADPSGHSRAGIAGSNPAGNMDSVSFECCALSGRGLCDGPIQRPEESRRMCACVIECDQLQQQPSTLTTSR